MVQSSGSGRTYIQAMRIYISHPENCYALQNAVELKNAEELNAQGNLNNIAVILDMVPKYIKEFRIILRV